MEPLSFTFAVVGMFQTCMQGYTLLSDAHRAPQDAQAATRRVRIESAVLWSWGQHVQISQNGHSYGKLEAYLSTSQTFNGVFKTLEAISEIFTNVRRMERNYGIVFKYNLPGKERLDVPRDIRDLLRGRSRSPASSPGRERSLEEKKDRLKQYQSDMSLLQECRWSWSGETQFSDLVKDLREYNDNLIRLCSWEALRQINRGIPIVALHGLNGSTNMDLLATAAEDGAKDKTSPFAEGRERIVEMARFKARLKTSSRIFNDLRSTRRLLNSADFAIARRRERDESWTLAIDQKTGTLNFIEWKTYVDPHGNPNRLAEEQIHLVGEFLCTPDRPADFRTLSCLGYFEDGNNHRYAFVHQLPQQLGSARPGWSLESLNKRRPTSLTELFGNGNVSEALDLGLRFTLAKRLMYSIIVIHACGWLHKDLRSDNIIFFPFQPNNAENYIPIDPNKKDFDHPYIMGYGLSRPDDVHDSADLQEGNPYSHDPLFSVQWPPRAERCEARSTPERRRGEKSEPRLNPERRRGEKSEPRLTPERRREAKSEPSLTLERRRGEKSEPRLNPERRRGEKSEPRLTLERRRGEKSEPRLNPERRRGEKSEPRLNPERRRGEKSEPRLTPERQFRLITPERPRGPKCQSQLPTPPMFQIHPPTFPRGDRSYPKPPSSGVESNEEHIDIYRHPSNHYNPLSRFRHSFDIYSLGIILLELGLWMSLKDLKLVGPGADTTAYRKYLLDRLVPDLKGRCGSIYEGVVRECLTLQCEDEQMDQESQRQLCWDVAERLGRCVA